MLYIIHIRRRVDGVSLAAMACRCMHGLLPGPRPLFVLSGIVDEPPLPRRRREERSLREPGPGKRSPWSREAGERSARRRVDDVTADNSSQDREIRQSRRVAGHRIGSE